MNRRDFIALGSSALLKSGTGEASSPQSQPEALNIPAAPPRTDRQKRPNILMLMADQLRKDCVGAYGNNVIKTPNLDRIAREGIQFQNAYTCTPSCTPARSALMTGLGPWKHGMLGMMNMATNRYPIKKAAALASAGYYTTSIGKNHYYPMANPHGYHHLISDEHCSYWFHDENEKEAQSSEERCDYESRFWSRCRTKIHTRPAWAGTTSRASRLFIPKSCTQLTGPGQQRSAFATV